MRIDWYTKAVLTVIAVLLGVIAARPYGGLEVVQAQGAFSGCNGTVAVAFSTAGQATSGFTTTPTSQRIAG
jgi:hypothetical protein